MYMCINMNFYFSVSYKREEQQEVTVGQLSILQDKQGQGLTWSL